MKQVKKEPMKDKKEKSKGVIGDQDPGTPGRNGPLASRIISRTEKKK